MKRHELWRQNYRSARDLDHLSPEQLSLRLFDCINNMSVRTERGKLGLRRLDEGGESWMIWMTEILEECVIRGYAYPGPINISSFGDAIDHAFDPIPNMDAALAKFRDAPSKKYLLKFGDPTWLRQSLEKGSFRICPASYYDRKAHNHARRDTELKREIIPNPRDSRASLFLTERGIPTPSGKVVSQLSVNSATDYYLFSLTTGYSSRLFGDFESTACLIIHDPAEFIQRFGAAVAERLTSFHFEVGLVTYYDPVRADARVVDQNLRFFKPFKHAYQDEIRLAWTPPEPVAELEPLFIEIGALAECAELVDIDNNPPLPPHPDDALVAVYGTFNEDKTMVNRLPEVGRLQGMILNREAHSHTDWFFEIQYTDKGGVWHEIKMPMPDGLYLLNMLREAEKRQELGFFNRE